MALNSIKNARKNRALYLNNNAYYSVIENITISEDP